MKKIKTHCVACNGKTSQKVLFLKRVTKKNEFEEGGIERYNYMTIQCGGCRTVSFLQRQQVEDLEQPGKKTWLDFNYPGDEAEMYPQFNFISEDDERLFPTQISNVYEEIKSNFENNSCISAGMTLRALVEAVCLQQKISGRNLQDKIKNLEAKGLISSAELPILDKLRLMGNSSAHDIKAFSIDKLNYALDIINHVLKSIYVLPKINKKLKL